MQGFIIGFIFGFSLKYALCKYADNCKCPQCSVKWMNKK